MGRVSCCGGASSTKGCTCAERVRLSGAGATTVIFTPDDGMRAVIGLVRATNTSGADQTFRLGVIDDGDDVSSVGDADWIVFDRPILAAESIDALRAATLGPGQKLIAAASSALVTFAVFKLERTA